MKQQKTSSLAKYRGLIVSVILFLVLTVSMLILNFIATQYFAQQSQITTLATQQGVFIQQMSKNLMDTDLYVKEKIHQYEYGQHNNQTEGQVVAEVNSIPLNDLSQDALYRIQEIQALKDNFENSLNVFEKGGEFQGVTVAAANGEAKKHVDRIREIWNPYLGLLDNFIADTKGNKINAKTSAYLVDYTRLYNQTLLHETQAMSEILNAHVLNEANIWQIIQLVALVIAFGLFAWIVFGALRQLMAGDQLLARANQEMSEIMSSVNEGLFLVDKDLVIGGQYSKRLEEIIEQQNLGNKNLMDVLEKLVPQEDVETTKVFIDQLYSDWVVEDLIEDLNPLHRISISDEGGKLKYLDFKFFRVWLDDKIERVLVSVTDSTESVQLQASLEAQKEQEGRELEMLNIILNTNPVILNSFIQNTVPRLEDINQTLKSPGEQKYELRNKIEHIARLIHSVKGEASSLKLNRMVGICEIFEDSLREIKNSPNLSGKDFLGLIVLLEELYQLFDVLKNYNTQMTGGSQQPASSKPKTPAEIAKEFAQAQETYFKQFVNDIAVRYDKQVNLVLEGFDNPALNTAQWDKIKDIVIQLLRNSVVHGIEHPDVRRQRNKQATGTLNLVLNQQADGNWVLHAEDDGNGIDFEAIRQKAVVAGLVKPEDAAGLEQRQLLNFMFSSGFSTAVKETEDAGRGVGMDIIKDTVQRMGGKISVASSPENYTRFSLRFPKV